MRRTALAIVGVLVAGTLGGLRAQVPHPDRDEPARLRELRQLLLDTQEALRALASEAGGFPQAATTTADVDLPHGGGIIRGRITAEATGAPVHAATVRAMLTSLDAAPVRAVTDSDGMFELRGLTPGRWRIDAAKSGFIGRSFGQHGTSPRVGTVTLQDRAVATADIALSRAAVLTGRVLDDFGEPAIGVRVQALRLQAADGRRLVPAGAADFTDDKGAFRVHGLTPGDYVVSARIESLNFSSLTPGDRVVSIPASSAGGSQGALVLASLPTYFPGTRDVSAAEPITLEAGEERAGLDFFLDRTPPVQVSGTIVDSSGVPMRPSLIRLFGPSMGTDPYTTLALGSPVLSTGNGGFSYRYVPPGQYAFVVVVLASTGHPEFADVPITVGAEDITGLTVVTAPGITLEGIVVSHDGSPLNLQGARVTALPAATASSPGASSTGAVVDGAFQLPHLHGSFRITVQGLPAGWTIRSVEVDGVDVTETPVTFTSGRPQATITVTNQITDLSGLVTSDRPFSEAEVAIFPADAATWTAHRLFGSQRTNSERTFSVRGLSPGVDYLAVATDYLNPGDLQDPEFLERLRPHATPFSLGEGETRRLSLKLVERSTIDGR